MQGRYYGDQLNISYSLLHRADETQQGRNSCPRLQFLAFSTGLYHVVAPLDFLRSIRLASLLTSLSIFSWSDLLQILRKQVAWHHCVYCLIEAASEVTLR